MPANARPLAGAIAGLSLLALAARVCGLGKGVWTDEVSSLAVLQSPSLLTALRNYDHPPLYFLLLKAWSSISSADAFLRAFSVLLSVATVPVVMKWVARYERSAALLAGLLTAFLPGMLASGLEIRGYALLLLATAAAYLAGHRFALEPSWSRATVLALALTAAVCTHLAGAVLVVSIAAYVLATAPELLRRRKLLAPLALAFAAPLALFCLIYLGFMGPGVRSRTQAAWWMPRPDMHELTNVVSHLTWLRSWVWLRVAWGGAHPFAVKLTCATAALVCVLLLLTLARGNFRVTHPLLLSVLVHNALLLAYSFVRVPIFGARTALPSIIGLIGFLSVHVATIDRVPLRRFAFAAASALSVLSGLVWVGHQAREPEEPAQALANDLQRAMSQDDLVVFYPGFVEGLVRHYDADLAPSKIVQGARMDNALVGEAADPLDLPGVLAQVQRVRPHTVFLVSRADSLALHAQGFERLRTLLESQLEPRAPEQFGSLWLTPFTARAPSPASP